MLKIQNRIIGIILVFSYLVCVLCGCNNNEQDKKAHPSTDYIDGEDWYFEEYPAKGNWILSDEILLENTSSDENILTSRKKIENTIADYIIDNCFNEYTKYIDKDLKKKDRKSVIRSIKNFNAIRRTLNYEYADFFDYDVCKNIITIDNVSYTLSVWISNLTFWYDDITLEIYESMCKADYELGKIGIFIDLEFKNKSFMKYEEGEKSPYRFEISPDSGSIASKVCNESGYKYDVTGKCCDNPEDIVVQKIGVSNDEKLMYLWVTGSPYSIYLLYLKNTDKIYIIENNGCFILERKP